jgi:O-antigen ligase
VALGVSVVVVFTFIVFSDLVVGVAAVGFLSFVSGALPSSGSLSLDKVAGLLLAVAWLAHLSKARAERDFFTDHPRMAWAIVLFLGWASVTLLWASQEGEGLSAIFRYLPNMLLLPIAYTAVRSRRDLIFVIGAIVFGAVVAAVFGILQPPDANFVEEGAGRATGTIGDPNELAAALVVGLALAAGLTLYRKSSLPLRLGAALAIPLCAAAIFLSLSRGGLVALGVTLVAGTFLAGRWRYALTGILVLTALSGFVYFSQIASQAARLRVTTASGGSGRTDLWTVAWRMIKAHPIEGVGVGSFQPASASYVLRPGTIKRADLIFSTRPKVAHNTYLQVLTEMGIPGLALFMTLVIGSVACALRAAHIWLKAKNTGMDALSRSVLLGLIGMLAADFFITETYGKLLWTMLAIPPAMLALARAEQKQRMPS